jgi:tetratricopeptide (TPR) repeat protein
MSESILWNEMGNLHMRLGAHEDAISAYGKAIELAPSFGLAYSNLGHAYSSEGKFDNAIPLFQKSIQLSNSSCEQSLSWKRLGDVYQKLGEYEKALAAYRMSDLLDNSSAKSIEPSIRDLGQQKMWSKGKAAEPEISDEDIEEALKLNSISPEPTDVARIPSEVKVEFDSELDEDDGEEDFPASTPPFIQTFDFPKEEFVPPDPVPVVAKEENSVDELLTSEPLPAFEEEFGELDSWLKSIDPVPALPVTITSSQEDEGDVSIVKFHREPFLVPNKSSNYVMREVDILESKPSIAEPTFEQTLSKIVALKKEHSNTEVLEAEKRNRMDLFKSWRLSELPEHDPEIWKTMLEALEKAQDKDKKNTELEIPQIESVAVAQVVRPAPVEKPRISRELLEGIENYRKITEMAPSNDKAWDTLGKLLKDAGEYGEAVTAFENAIALCPEKDLYHYHLGLVYAAQKRHDEAIISFQRVIELNPSYTLAHCALAGSYRRTGMESEADKHIQIAMPRLSAETEYNRACFEAICGNTDQAIELLRQALVKKQTSPDWVRGDPDMDFIRDDPRFKELVGA